MPTILPDGSYKKDNNGVVIKTPTPNADSGIFIRGSGKAQVNLWCWACGSGELWGVRNDKSAPAEVRAAAVPKVKADNPVGLLGKYSGQGAEPDPDFKYGVCGNNLCSRHYPFGALLVYQKILPEAFFGGQVSFLQDMFDIGV